jgi:hypothetical protein
VTAPTRRRVAPLLPAEAGRGPRPEGEQRSLLRGFTVGAVVLSLVALGAMALGAFALSGLTTARAQVLSRVTPAVDAGQELTVALLDQETGVRGFALSGGREEFLAPYESGRSAGDDALAALSARTDEPVASEVAALAEGLRGWRQGYADPLVAAVRAGAPAPDAVAGRALYDTVRARSGALVERLQEEQRQGRTAVADATSFLVLAAVIVAGVMIAILVTVAVGLRRTVLRPVSDLAEQVRSVVSGDGVRPVRVDGPREIAQLGADVEAMRLRILTDLQESREVNSRLDDQARELERSNRDLEQFAYVASHDLQEPLRKVSSFCQLLQRRYGGQLDERADQYIGFAVDGAQRMQQLINDLLAFSRVGRTTEGFVPVPLGDVLAAATTQLEAVRADTGGEIVVADDLPVVDGDPQLLRQLFVNVLGNGLKFHRDGVPPVVRVAAERDGDEWAVTVTDNGIGIDEEYADKVFVIFQRLHARDRYPGTGIGLALSKKIAEFHGGRIRLTTPESPGTTVRITFPEPGSTPA